MKLVVTGSKKNPHMTKVDLIGSRNLLQPHMLLLKSVNFVLMMHRITGTAWKENYAGSCVTCGARVKVLTIQHNHWSRIYFSIQECIFRIRRIQGKMRSTVWTV
jgi:hypothetical protein